MAKGRRTMMEFLGRQGDQPAAVTEGLKRDLPVDRIVPRRSQPRSRFDQEELETLAITIRELGIIQPLVVRPLNEAGTERYEIIAGERRWRAAQLAQLATVPVIVRHLDDERVALYSLAENIARRNLNPIEQARGYHAVLQENRLSQTELAEAIGQNVKTVNRILRLLKLPEEIQALIEQEQLTAKHGELLLGVPRMTALNLAHAASEREWSVRELERRLAQAGKEPAQPASTPTPKQGSPDLDRERLLWSEQLGADVNLQYWKTGKVRITITVGSLDEYEGIRERLGLAD